MEAVEVFSDLEGHRINGVTVPPKNAITGLKPDLVIVKRQSSPLGCISRIDSTMGFFLWDGKSKEKEG